MVLFGFICSLLFALKARAGSYQTFTGTHAHNGHSNPANASDDNLATFSTGVMADDSGIPLALTCNSTLADKVKYYLEYDGAITDPAQLTVYVEVDGSWVLIFGGSPVFGEWVEKTITGGPKTITGVKIDGPQCKEEESGNVYCKEVQFYDVTAGVTFLWGYLRDNFSTEIDSTSERFGF